MGVQVVFVIVLMLASTVKSQEERAKFWRSNVTLTCPGAGNWFDKHDGKDKIPGIDGEIDYNFKYDKTVKYRCEYEVEKKYLFYVKGQACENCFELDATLILVAIVVDVVGTGVVMMIICKCSKKRSSDGPAHSHKPPVPSGSRAPTVPSRDYEQLNPRTRAADTYSTVVNRMG